MLGGLIASGLRIINGTTGECELSHYKIVLGGIDHWLISHMNPRGSAKTHSNFFEKMKRIDKQVADKLNKCIRKKWIKSI